MFQFILGYEALFIKIIQIYFGELDIIFKCVNNISDATYALSVLFPLIEWMNLFTAYKLLSLFVIIKMPMMWIKGHFLESRRFERMMDMSLINKVKRKFGLFGLESEENHVICETAPGLPSLHLMFSAAMLYGLLHWAKSKFEKDSIYLTNTQKTKLNKALWTIVILCLTIISISRIYLTASFPHQCITGALLGILIGRLLIDEGRWGLNNWWMRTSRIQLYLLGVVFMFTSVLIDDDVADSLFGFAPGLLVESAFWCNQNSNARTLIFLIIAGVVGSAMGIQASSFYNTRVHIVRGYPVISCIKLILAFLGQLFFNPAMPQHYTVLNYIYRTMVLSNLPGFIIFNLILYGNWYIN